MSKYLKNIYIRIRLFALVRQIVVMCILFALIILEILECLKLDWSPPVAK